jgi:hypothetical protein
MTGVLVLKCKNPLSGLLCSASALARRLCSKSAFVDEDVGIRDCGKAELGMGLDSRSDGAVRWSVQTAVWLR